MKVVNVDNVLKILHKYGKYIFVTDEKKYSDMVDEISNLKALEQESILDKIREEIKVMTSNRGFLSCSVGYIHKEIDNVFDKYKAETEA